MTMLTALYRRLVKIRHWRKISPSRAMTLQLRQVRPMLELHGLTPSEVMRIAQRTDWDVLENETSYVGDMRILAFARGGEDGRIACRLIFLTGEVGESELLRAEFFVSNPSGLRAMDEWTAALAEFYDELFQAHMHAHSLEQIAASKSANNR